jgi:hypothetical protein
MRRLIAAIAMTAAFAPVITQAQTLSAQQQALRAQQNLNAQEQRDKVETDNQIRQSQNRNIQAQQNAQSLQIQGNQLPVNPNLQPGVTPYASSSAAARAGAVVGTGAPASASVPDMVGGPLNLPGPTDPAVRNYTVSPEPAPNQPASSTPVRKP